MAKNGPLKYHGGKSYLAKWIKSLAPPSASDEPEEGYTHRNIAYAGGLGELWSWPCEEISEAVNDSNGDLTNFYVVMRDKKRFGEFTRLLGLTPFSQASFEKAGDVLKVPVESLLHTDIERAVAYFVRNRMSRQGLATDYATPTRRRRRGMNENVSAYLSVVDDLVEFHNRLRRVEVRNTDALKFIEEYDHPRALFYCDPTYLKGTRSSGGEYGKHEMTAAQHYSLLKLLGRIEGKFMLSGYPSDMYQRFALKAGWNVHTKEIDNKASSGKTKRIETECVWTNY